MLGIPAFQLEIPPTLRKALVDDDVVFRAFLETVHIIYTDVIVPEYSELDFDNIREMPLNGDLKKVPVVHEKHWEKLLAEVRKKDISK